MLRAFFSNLVLFKIQRNKALKQNKNFHKLTPVLLVMPVFVHIKIIKRIPNILLAPAKSNQTHMALCDTNKSTNALAINTLTLGDWTNLNLNHAWPNHTHVDRIHALGALNGRLRRCPQITLIFWPRFFSIAPTTPPFVYKQNQVSNMGELNVLNKCRTIESRARWADELQAPHGCEPTIRD